MDHTRKLTNLCDQLVSEIETGDIDAAILQLSGTLDGAISAGANGQKLRALLKSHPISEFLNSDCHNSKDACSTIRRIENARQKIAGEKALQLRREKRSVALNDAWRRGAKICSFDIFDPAEMPNLAGRDLSNIKFMERAEPQKNDSWHTQTALFDVIFATSVADETPTEDFHKFLQSLPPRMSENGRILISFFVPGHSGLGWRIFRSPDRAFCHWEHEITRSAVDAGLAVNSYSDPNGCMIWAELSCLPAH